MTPGQASAPAGADGSRPTPDGGIAPVQSGHPGRPVYVPMKDCPYRLIP